MELKDTNPVIRDRWERDNKFDLERMARFSGNIVAHIIGTILFGAVLFAAVVIGAIVMRPSGQEGKDAANASVLFALVVSFGTTLLILVVVVIRYMRKLDTTIDDFLKYNKEVHNALDYEDAGLVELKFRNYTQLKDRANYILQELANKKVSYDLVAMVPNCDEESKDVARKLEEDFRAKYTLFTSAGLIDATYASFFDRARTKQKPTHEIIVPPEDMMLTPEVPLNLAQE